MPWFRPRTFIRETQPVKIAGLRAGPNSGPVSFSGVYIFKFRQDDKNGAPGRIRTPNLLIRSQALYPVELRAQPRHSGRKRLGKVLKAVYDGKAII